MNKQSFKFTQILLGVSITLCLFSITPAHAGAKPFADKFRQLDELLPTPNTYRTASGAPGHQYWQQRADYKISATLNDKKQRIKGKETITYYNNSPDTLTYIWLQLDQNRFRRNSDSKKIATPPFQPGKDGPKVNFNRYRTMLESPEFNGGFHITKVTDQHHKKLHHVINKTMMRIDLPSPLKHGETFTFNINWNYQIREQKVLGGRAGYEYFKDDGNYIYEIAQWFPRMAAYYDVYGWQHKQFLGRGEFTLEFGNYDVEITAPADHIVGATGVLQNADKVLTEKQRKLLSKARTAKKPVIIVSQKEATAKEKKHARTTKTWHFKAENVRDFAFASSRKFIWDAQGYKAGDTDVMAMSYYPKEGNPLWERYSTQAVIHTIKNYNKYSLQFPYPVAISVNGPVGGMEYPMICFNGPRPEKDKKTGKLTYSRRTKYGLISVIIHEVGHNYYPMIVNSDERQWTWMDEGLNTFVQYLTEQAWEEKYPSRRGSPRKIINYMKSDHQVPIMTNSESLLQFGNNAYGKPATALNILRETIMGRELFDFAFKTYAERWKFKRPTPADLFRTLEDASGVDLDWFFRGWFYSSDNVDISIDKVTHFKARTLNPDIDKEWDRQQFEREPEDLSDIRNKKLAKIVDKKRYLKDFYNKHDKFTVTNADRNKYHKMMQKLDDWEKAQLKKNPNMYVLDFSNNGGLVMPILLELKYKDGSTERYDIPAEIWKRTPEHVSKLLIRNKQLVAVTVDPNWETADVDTSNNYWPRKIIQSPLEIFKDKRKNLMKDFQQKLKPLDDEAEFKTRD